MSNCKKKSSNINDHNPGEVKAHFDRWHIYKQIIRNDYQSHRGIHDSLRRCLVSIVEPEFDVLDLGCGNGSGILKTLDGLPVRSYIGVDLSAVALAEASKGFSQVRYEETFARKDPY
uniref:Methyltransferase domain-containing protein n=1 Tax=Candidatus Kentrum sp. LPFa TaxID=2126335 RepID=A0A450WSL9_9GAMM|nr:MAG: Methyltransferase domain-containing protein [Candidatus Kentron sp. LPFa]